MAGRKYEKGELGNKHKGWSVNIRVEYICLHREGRKLQDIFITKYDDIQTQ
jgi:hypothetical protein